MTSSRTYVGAGLIAVAALLFWILAMPAYDYIGGLRIALEERQTIVDNRTAILANIDSLGQQYSEYSADIRRFENIVPATKSAPELVSAIQAIATQNGLTLTSLALTGVPPGKGDMSLYNTQPIDIGLFGSYPSLRSFLEALESNIRLIDVVSIEASPSSENSTVIGFRIKANAYFLKNAATN
ncbi:MAG: hypothetical protein A3C88_01760 [Candidatus Yanofskybacteria bacterium RIFCSPHIGHO2_02_FULL_50_12]|uniref:Pilus assembly protein PilO n=1 Tax=Candidatus Yanofskybacteria bacterium RIFCSPHIGHO2_02_FULL_50_12 TaxID=1802685 RepID=A0A1F8FVX6_9BACT|nr:MAG: hypothetical protein A3C88_01760 [Candidatus Yanofskybacteria bacterium RIFCSPHIGHO2_02_FULL_50_12]